MSTVVAGEYYNYKFPLKESRNPIKFFKSHFQLNMKTASENGFSIEFEMLNAPPIFHNTIRRLILEEVPSIAVDKVYIYNNTGVIEDSDLQLRIGLLPIDVDPDSLNTYDDVLPMTDSDLKALKTDSCLLFELILKYKKRPHKNSPEIRAVVEKFEKGNLDKFIEEFDKRLDMSVYSDDIKWVPLADQSEKFNNVKAVEDILLARIMPGEEIYLRGLAIKGYGHDHAKFIPTSASHGRMAINIELDGDIRGDDAKTLQSLFPEGVIEIKNGKAVVANTALIPRTHKNYEEFDNLRGKVRLTTSENHYFWLIESVRPKNQPAHKILTSAFQIMMDKCQFYVANLEKLQEAVKESKTGSVDAESFGKTLSGKFCYIDLAKTKGNPKFPMYRFYGETATLGASLSYLISNSYSENVMSAYSSIDGGIELTVEVIGTKLKMDTTEILKKSLLEMSECFGMMKETFQEKYASFVNHDVDME